MKKKNLWSACVLGSGQLRGNWGPLLKPGLGAEGWWGLNTNYSDEEAWAQETPSRVLQTEEIVGNSAKNGCSRDPRQGGVGFLETTDREDQRVVKSH